MSSIYVLTAIGPRNVVLRDGIYYVDMIFSGVYYGHHFRKIVLESDSALELADKMTPCVCKIKINEFEKDKITGKLLSIKFLEEFQ